MQDQDLLHQTVRQVMLEVMTVLWAHGQTKLHVGAVMRLLGVPDEEASRYDNEKLDIAENLSELAQIFAMQESKDIQVPAGVTIH